MLARITFNEFSERLNSSSVARGCFSYEAKNIIFDHLNQDEDYVMPSCTDVAIEWAESTYEDLKTDWDYDESFRQIYKDAQDGCDSETELRQYHSTILAGVAEWLSEKTIYLDRANCGEDCDLGTTTFVHAKNF